MKFSRLASYLVCLLVAIQCNAEDHGHAVPLDDPRWQIDAEESEVASHLGRDGVLKLRRGHAVLADLELRNGMVETMIEVSDWDPEVGGY